MGWSYFFFALLGIFLYVWFFFHLSNFFFLMTLGSKYRSCTGRNVIFWFFFCSVTFFNMIGMMGGGRRTVIFSKKLDVFEAKNGWLLNRQNSILRIQSVYFFVETVQDDIKQNLFVIHHFISSHFNHHHTPAAATKVKNICFARESCCWLPIHI